MFTQKETNRSDGFLNHKNHYDFQSSKLKQFKDKHVDESALYAWTKQNMYRTSYINHYTEKPAEPKNVAIPGYKGYIPYVKSENKFGKRYSALTRDCFDEPKLGENKYELSSTGFNLARSVLIDQSKKASSSKYGKTGLQLPHPAWIPQKNVSTAHETYIHPKERMNPTFRKTGVNLQTQKHQTKTSGFSQNHAYLDGTGWNPHAILNGDHHRSQYRDRFNEKLNFHRDSAVFKSRTLPKGESNYRFNY